MIVIKFGKWETKPEIFYTYGRIGKSIFCRRKRRHRGRFYHPWKYFFIRKEIKKAAALVNSCSADNFYQKNIEQYGELLGLLAMAETFLNIKIGYPSKPKRWKDLDKKGRNKKEKKRK